jgi:CubicO group peptidase (beta-lactamase class C family)
LKKRVILAGALAAVVGAAAADDARFWWRYAVRLPSLLGMPGAAPTAQTPDSRATIAGAPRTLRICAPSATEARALAGATAYAGARATKALVVFRDDCLIGEHYWAGDATTQRAGGPMAKVVMALVAGRMLATGQLHGVDRPVARVLREWRGDARRAITWRHMLTMHAGLTWYRQQPGPWSRFQRLLLSGDYAPRAIALPAVAPPGRFYDYSAWTYDTLGIALSRAGQAPYETLVSRLLWRPLGLSDASLFVDRPGGTVHGNCCMDATARDWGRLGAFLGQEMRTPRMIPASYLAAMRTPSPDRPDYGLGVWLGSPYVRSRSPAAPRNPYPTPVKSQAFQSVPYRADDVLIFEGVQDSKVWVIPSAGLSIVRLGAKGKDWDDAVIPNLLLDAR